MTTTVPTLSRSPLARLKKADTDFLSSTNNKPLQTNTKLNAAANPCQMLFRPHTAANIGHSAV